MGAGSDGQVPGNCRSTTGNGDGSTMDIQVNFYGTDDDALTS